MMIEYGWVHTDGTWYSGDDAPPAPGYSRAINDGGVIRGLTNADYRAQQLRETWAAQQTARQRREAQAILAAPENETTIDQRINAINLLNGVI